MRSGVKKISKISGAYVSVLELLSEYIDEEVEVEVVATGDLHESGVIPLVGWYLTVTIWKRVAFS